MTDRPEVLFVHGVLAQSRVNGPGLRTVIWTQGCTLGCPGCCNPDTHDPGAGAMVTVEVLARQILAHHDTIDGITLSGGEPCQQMAAVTTLLDAVRQESRLSVLLFTGYPWPRLEGLPGAKRLLGLVDVVVAGPFVRERPVSDGLRASANQTIHQLTDRYSPAELLQPPSAEVVIRPDGELVVTGLAAPDRRIWTEVAP